MTQTFRPALLGLVPLLAFAALLAALLMGRPAAFPINPVINLPGVDSAPSAAPASPVDAAPVAPALEPVVPARPTTMPGNGTAPSVTAAPGAIPPPARPVTERDPLPYPNLPSVERPLGQ